MTNRSSHTGKSRGQKEYYMGRLGTLDYEPTVETEPAFPSSDDFKKDYSVSPPGGRRPPSFTEAIISPLKKNIAGIIIAIITGLFIIFVYNFSRDLGSLEGSVNEIKNVLNSVQQTVEKIGDKVQEQEIKNREQDIRMDYMEKQAAGNQLSPIQK